MENYFRPLDASFVTKTQDFVMR